MFYSGRETLFFIIIICLLFREQCSAAVRELKFQSRTRKIGESFMMQLLDLFIPQERCNFIAGYPVGTFSARLNPYFFLSFVFCAAAEFQEASEELVFETFEKN